MGKTIKYIGLDVHKKSISIAVAGQGRNGGIKYYGQIDNNMDQLDKHLEEMNRSQNNPPYLNQSPAPAATGRLQP